MRLKSHFLFMLLSLWALPSYAQFGLDDLFWSSQVYRSGSILSYEREVDGRLMYQAENQSVNNFTANINIDNKQAYGCFDFTVLLLGVLNQDQNQHWSYNVTLGAFLVEEPIEWGPARMVFGAGIDLDLSTYVINDLNNEEVSFESGTIGANFRFDIELWELLLIKNSITRGWWNPDNSHRWDVRSSINLALFDGFYLTATPNYQSLSLDTQNANGRVKESSRHFYINYGLSVVFDM